MLGVLRGSLCSLQSGHLRLIFRDLQTRVGASLPTAPSLCLGAQPAECSTASHPPRCHAFVLKVPLPIGMSSAQPCVCLSRSYPCVIRFTKPEDRQKSMQFSPLPPTRIAWLFVLLTLPLTPVECSICRIYNICSSVAGAQPGNLWSL